MTTTFIAAPIVIAPGDEPEPLLQLARYARQQGARLIEWRVDLVPDEPILVAELVRASPLPAIVTCRRVEEGGSFAGAESARIALLQHLLQAAPPAYIDLEASALEQSRELRAFVGLGPSVRPGGATSSPTLTEAPTRLILSMHDFEGRPADLYQRLARMTEDVPQASVLKIAWMARSLRDNLEAFELLRHRPRPMIALCMGPFGLPSRVLAPKFGGMVTFAVPGAGAAVATAPGQPSIETLVDRYRFDRILPRTQVYGVIGWPIEHSASPDVHNAGFEAIGHDGVYLPLPVPPEYEHFKATVGSFVTHEGLDFAGASITAPHKEHALRLAREWQRDEGGMGMAVRIDPLAAEVGAANTLIVRRVGRTPHAADPRREDEQRRDVALGVPGEGPSEGPSAPLDATAMPRFTTVELLNTDAPALVESALVGLGMSEADAAAVAVGGDLRGLRVAVIGAGGVARAAVIAFAARGATVVIYSRNDDRAAALARDLRGGGGSDDGERPDGSPDASRGGGSDAPAPRQGRRRVIAARFDRLPRTCAHIIMNCTPAGMQGGPAPEDLPLPGITAGGGGRDRSAEAEPQLPPSFGRCRRSGRSAIATSPIGADSQRPWTAEGPALIFDTVYVPLRTPFLRAAEAAGLPTLNGLDMFVRQAARQFEAWTGRHADRALIRRTAARRIFEQGEVVDDEDDSTFSG